MVEKVTVEDLSREFKRIFFDRFLSRVRDVVSGDSWTNFHDRLVECNLSHHDSNEYDNVIKQVFVTFDLSKDIDDLEQLCQQFLSSLLLLGLPKSNELSRELRKEWNSKAKDVLGEHYDYFVKEETSKRDEIEMLTEFNVQPMQSRVPEAEKPQHFREKKKQSKTLALQDNFDAENSSLREFDKFYSEIVDIICDNDIVLPFAHKLSDVGLLASAMRDEVEKMTSKIIQAKAVVGELRTLVMRGVIPKKLLLRFIGVMSTSSFRKYFQLIISKMRIDGYSIRDETVHLIETWHYVNEDNSTASRNHFSLLKKLKETDLPRDDPYLRHLYLRYQKIKPMTFSTPAHEWKFSDIAASDGSVTKTNKSGGALDLKCIPQKLDYPPRTLIVGGPGVGKSSIVIELCKRWYNKDLLHEYKYVILLQGHDPQISNAESVDDFVLPHHREWMIPIIKEDGRNSLFIIDGYEQLDEKCRHHDSFINHFISGKILPEASFVVTTRPWSAKMISEYFSNEVEILGFTPQGRKEFIDHNLGGNADDFCLQKPIERCCAIPFCLATLIEIYQEKRRAPQTSNESQVLPKTLSMLYGELIRTLVLRYVRKNPEYSKFMPDSIDILPGEFLKFPGPIYKKFLELCAFSFNSMERSGLFVRNARLGMVTFDLFEKHDRNTTSGNKIYYSCLHSSIQEYLAAYCISRMTEKMMKKCISSLKSYSRQYHLILEFLAGFGCTSFVDGPHNIFSNIHDFHIFRQLCEANSDEIIQNAFLHHVNPCIIKRTWPIPSPADFWCLGKVIALSNHEWELGFTLRRLQNTHLKMLCEGINSVDMPSGQIRKFSFSLNNFNEDGLVTCSKSMKNVCSRQRK